MLRWASSSQCLTFFLLLSLAGKQLAVCTLLMSFLPPVPLRAHACLAGSDSYRDPAPAAGPSVGAAGLQPHPLSHLLLVPVLPLLHAYRGQRWEQRHCQRVSVRGAEHVSLHPERPATLPIGPRPTGTGQPRRQEGEQRGHLPDWGGQWVGGFILPCEQLTG